MIAKDEIKKLARLARIGIEEAELERVQRDLDRILEYVSQLQEVEEKSDGWDYLETNVMREDNNPHPPQTGGDYVKVKKVIDYDA